MGLKDIPFFIISILLVMVSQIHAEELSINGVESPRKGNLTVKLLDENGTPWANATVIYTQKTHDFLFGVGMTSPQGRVPPHIYRDLKSKGINYALPFVSWSNVEPMKGEYAWDTIDYMYRPAEMHQLGYTLDGHAMIWFFDAPWNLPDYMSSMSFDELNQVIYNHVYDLVTHYQGHITYWTINEPLYYNMAIELSYDEWAEVIRTTTQAVYDADPNSTVIINLLPIEQPTINYYPKQLLNMLKNQGVEYDVIGLQIYADPRTGNKVDEKGYTDIEWTSSILDSYANFGKPVVISETCVPDKPSLEAQAEWLHRFYAMAFEKPYVIGITWYFMDDDLTVDSPAFSGCGLYPNFDSSPRPVYQALADVIQERTTSGITRTNSKGLVRIEGYAGDYVIEVSDSIKASSFTVHITEGEDNSILLEARSPPDDNFQSQTEKNETEKIQRTKKEAEVKGICGPTIMVALAFVPLLLRREFE